MKKIRSHLAALLLVALMLSLVSCTDDFNFIDKSGADTTTAGEGNPSSGGENNNQGSENNNQGGNQGGGSGNQGGGSNEEDPFYKDGWGTPFPY